MNNYFNWLVIACNCCILNTAVSQNLLENQVPQEIRYNHNDVVDSVHGITMYEQLNFRLAWDSVRNCKGYACNGLVKDYYENGKLLHKGIYIEGQLNNYTNYYQNGHVERSFRIIDDYRSMMTLYYPNGNIKSRHKYLDNVPVLWEDHYPNGQMSYYMEMDESFDHHISKKHWQEDGKLLSELVLVDKKKLAFKLNEYYENGKHKVKGHLIYNQQLFKHIKTGKWSYYNENGKLAKIELYDDGTLIEEKIQK